MFFKAKAKPEPCTMTSEQFIKVQTLVKECDTLQLRLKQAVLGLERFQRYGSKPLYIATVSRDKDRRIDLLTERSDEYRVKDLYEALLKDNISILQTKYDEATTKLKEIAPHIDASKI